MSDRRSRRPNAGARGASAKVLLAALLAVASLWLVPASPAAAAPGDDLVSILVMGDSYSAGNGANQVHIGEGGYYGPKGCWRSPYNYGRQYQRIIESHPFNQRAFVENVACSGAVTADFFTPQKDRSVPAQLAELDERGEVYDIIFLTIGGNDLKFAEIVRKCFIRQGLDGVDCNNLLTVAESELRDGVVEQKITRVLKAIQNKAHPNARIVLLGYPYLEGDPNYQLHLGGFSSEYVQVGARTRAIGDAGDAAQMAAVDAANARPGKAQVVFVGTKDLFKGHELRAAEWSWSGLADRWFIEPFDTPLAYYELWYHPNHIGHLQEARLLAADPRVPKHDVNAIAPPSARQAIDIVMAIDATGSMLDDITAVKNNMTSLVGRLDSSGADWRISIVTYKDLPPQGDAGDYAARLEMGFTSSASEATGGIAGISVSGGGDIPETVLSGLNLALAQPFRADAKKVVLLMGDAPPHDPEQHSGLTSAAVIAAAGRGGPAEVARSARAATAVGGVAIYPVLISASPELVGAFLPFAEGTGGKLFTSTGGIDVVDAVAEVFDDVAALPVAHAGGPYAGVTGQEIPLSASASFDPDGSIVSYAWDFTDDGIFDVVTDSPLATTAYHSAFDGQVRVLVTDDDGGMSSATATVEIVAPEGSEAPSVPPGSGYGSDGSGQQDEARASWNSFVKAAYEDFLGRPPSDGELSSAVADLAAGRTTRAALVQKLSTSSEWVSSLIKRFYVDTLGREGDQAGTSYWTGELSSGRRTVAEVVGYFYASDEYFAGAGATDEAWIADLYDKLLSREPDGAGTAYWAERAAVNRHDVAIGFFDSVESRGDRVDRLYDALLNRKPDQAGRAHWIEQILTGGDLVLSADLAASGEYYDRAKVRFPT